MKFNEQAFCLFCPIVFWAYWALRRHLGLQNALVLVASYVFYGWWDWRFLSLLIVSSLCDYLIGLRMADAAGVRRRRLLQLSLAVNLGLLGCFKYFGFFVGSLADGLTALGLRADLPTLSIVLPVGISFYTFQTLSYTIDIYRGRLQPTRDPIQFFAFVSFFPQLVAGPIERASALLPQFARPRVFCPAQARDGLRLILWGFVKKVVVADNLAGAVDAIFANHASCDGSTLIAGALFFAVQIYCDFSGYSDIAIGVARLFGFELMRNFAFPYFATNIAEFWRRWHISLSTWFRDYVFVPLGGSRVGTTRRVVNILVTFTVSGLWHGASWTFVAWGLLNGLYYLPLMLMRSRDAPARGALRPLAGMTLTFSATLVAWVLFRAESMPHALAYLAGVVRRPLHAPGPVRVGQYKLLLAGIAVLAAFEWLQRRRPHALDVGHLPGPCRWGLYLLLCLLFLTFGHFGAVDFIYFQF